MKLDNQTIMMVVVAIVLGMLVANMFKEVCGCKVVEGQCARGNRNCQWTPEGVGSVGGQPVSCSSIPQPADTLAGSICGQTGDQSSQPLGQFGQFRPQNVGGSRASYWHQTPCCQVPMCDSYSDCPADTQLISTASDTPQTTNPESVCCESVHQDSGPDPPPRLESGCIQDR